MRLQEVPGAARPALRHPHEGLSQGPRMRQAMSIRNAVPTVLSGLRLGTAPVTFMLITGRYGLHSDEAAVALMGAAAVSDVADGWLARRWGVVTETGAQLDLWADRACIIAVIAGFTLGHVIPWWTIAVLCMAAFVPAGAISGFTMTGTWF